MATTTDKKKNSVVSDEPKDETMAKENKDSYDELVSKFNDLNEKYTTLMNFVMKQMTTGTNSTSGEVTLVYMSDSLGIIDKVPGVSLSCTQYGEEFTLPRSQFDQIVGVYRKWFDDGILAVSSRNLDVAAAKGLRTDAEYAVKRSTLDKLATMSPAQITDLWNSCKSDAERLSIVTHYKRKFAENKEPGYRDMQKVFTLNSLSNNGLQVEADEISRGKKKKLVASDFVTTI